MSFPTASSRSNPCPICGRNTDGDCRISDNGERVLCHRGSTFSPPVDLRKGQIVPGKDGNQWGYVGETADDRAAQFVLHQPITNTARSMPSPPLPAGRTPIAGAITLATLPQPAEQPPDHWPSGHGFPYSDHQRVVVRLDGQGGKSFRVAHRTADGQWVSGKGDQPWPLWQQAEALAHGPRHWILEAEGEKCAEWIRAAGYVAISQPGHNHVVDSIADRYRALVSAGICGVVYLADNDSEGRTKADKCAKAAAAADLPFLALNAADLWPDLPAKGSIDDAPGSPADRLAVVSQAITSAAAAQASRSGDDTKTRLTKAELQRFVADTFQVEWNELTRDVELGGAPMGANLHLADSFLADTNGIEATKQAAADCFEYVARSNPYNPVRRYLQNLRHRTDLRLIPMAELAAAFAIEPHDHLSQSLLARHLAAAVHRGMTPGYKHDQILVFCGGQGTNKSQSIAALAGHWFDSATRVEDLEHREFLARLNSAWLFEFDECEHMLLKRTAAEFKGFLSRSQDRYVEKYEKTAQDHPRRSIAFGTTNQDEFLNDHTGNRRAWVIEVCDRLLDPVWIAANRDSIWATVITWIDWGLVSYIAPGDPLQALAAQRAADAQLSDMWETTLSDYLTRRTVSDGNGIAQDDLARGALGFTDAQLTRDVQCRITRVVTGSTFRTHGGEIAWKKDRRRFGGGPSRRGYRPLRAPVAGAVADAGSRSNDPTSTTEKPGVGTGVGTGHCPWQNSDLSSLFQLFQPIRGGGSSKDVDTASGATRVACTDSPERLEQVGTLEHPSDSKGFRRSNLDSVPTQDRIGHQNSRQCDRNTSISDDIAEPAIRASSVGNVDPAPAGPLPSVGDLVEARPSSSHPWQPGYQVMGLDGEHLKLRSPNSNNCLHKRIASNGRTWRHVA